MTDVLLLLYCAAVGFSAAGITASFYELVTSQPARFAPIGHTIFGLATTFVFCALAGPLMLVNLATRDHRTERGRLRWVLAGVGLSAMWSCCSGALILGFILVF
jgi:hypothetical protein